MVFFLLEEVFKVVPNVVNAAMCSVVLLGRNQIWWCVSFSKSCAKKVKFFMYLKQSYVKNVVQVLLVSMRKQLTCVSFVLAATLINPSSVLGLWNLYQVQSIVRLMAFIMHMHHARSLFNDSRRVAPHCIKSYEISWTDLQIEIDMKNKWINARICIMNQGNIVFSTSIGISVNDAISEIVKF